MPRAPYSPLAEIVPQSAAEMSVGETQILRALALMAQRIDDVVQRDLMDCQVDIKEIIATQDQLVSTVEKIESTVRNGVSKRLEGLETNLEGWQLDIGKIRDGLKAHEKGAGGAARVWQWLKKRPFKALVMVLVILTALPWLQKVAAVLLETIIRKATGLDLPTLIPWLFG